MHSRTIPIDTLDNLDRLTAQALAVVKCLIAANENCNLPPRIVSDTLWLVSDCLDDIVSQLELATPPAEQDSQPVTKPRPYMIREVVTNIPGWWLGETPVIEYEAARWPTGGRIQTRQFKTLAEAEAWAQEGGEPA